jgi:hypothetical protein
MFVMPLLTTQKWSRVGVIIGAGLLFLAVSASGQANPAFWKLEWPQTDFSKSNVPFDEIFSAVSRETAFLRSTIRSLARSPKWTGSMRAPSP